MRYERTVRPRTALAEDLRRVGVALIIAGLVGGFMREHVPGAVAVAASVLGAIGCAVGYWLHQREY